MRKQSFGLLTGVSLVVLAGALSQSIPTAYAQEGKWQDLGAAPTEGDIIEQGRQISFDRKKGNCLACHMIEGGTLPGNIGPPLLAMKARFPEKAKLREQIADPTKANPNSIMPPFEKHGILSTEEVDKVTEFIYSL